MTGTPAAMRSEEHTSEPSHLVISYAVFCLKKKNDYKPIRGKRAPPLGINTRSPAYLLDAPDRDACGRKPASLIVDPSQTYVFFLMIRRPPRSTPFPYTPLFR